MMYKSSFFFKSDLDDIEQDDLLEFYNNLSSKDQQRVDALIRDAVEETKFEFDVQ